MFYETIEMLIDGQWRGKDGGEGGGEDIFNPATNEVLGVCPHASTNELDMALAAAEKGFRVWRDTSPSPVRKCSKAQRGSSKAGLMRLPRR